MGDEYLSTEHLLVALASDVGTERAVLASLVGELRGTTRVTSPTPENNYEALERLIRSGAFLSLPTTARLMAGPTSRWTTPARPGMTVSAN